MCGCYVCIHACANYLLHMRGKEGRKEEERGLGLGNCYARVRKQ